MPAVARLPLLAVVLAASVLSMGSQLAAFENVSPDIFIVRFHDNIFVTKVTRFLGNNFVTMHFRDPHAIPPTHLYAANTTYGEFTPTGMNHSCGALMEVFEAALPLGVDSANLRGIQQYRDRKGLFALPTVMVASVPAIANFGGGTWRGEQDVPYAGYHVSDTECVYGNGAGGTPTPGPWLDIAGFKEGSDVALFGPNRSIMVFADSPAISNIGLNTVIGQTVGGDDVQPQASSPLGWSDHFSTFLHHDCDSPPDGDTETLFFRVDWGYDMVLSGFTADPSDTLGYVIVSRVSVVTNPPSGLPPQANSNGAFPDAQNRTEAPCQN